MLCFPFVYSDFASDTSFVVYIYLVALVCYISFLFDLWLRTWCLQFGYVPSRLPRLTTWRCPSPHPSKLVFMVTSSLRFVLFPFYPVTLRSCILPQARERSSPVAVLCRPLAHPDLVVLVSACTVVMCVTCVHKVLLVLFLPRSPLFILRACFLVVFVFVRYFSSFLYF